MIRRPEPKIMLLLSSALIATVVMGVLAIAVGFRNADLDRFDRLGQHNCQAVEALKTQLRADHAYDEREARQVLAQLGIDPESLNGRALLDRGRHQAILTARRFAPQPCP